MARRGRFGQGPRTAPDLTATLIAIANSMQSQRDNNIVDAWKNGGSFEGKPVTDERLLAYWRNRLGNLSRDDPAYDTTKNTVFQYEYAIAESKMETLYAQEKVSDSQMAAFFIEWSKKMPVNSEFYRSLQQDAAKFMQAARAKGAAGAARAKSDAFGAYQDSIVKQYIASGSLLTSVMTQIARDNNLIGQTEDLSDFQLNGQNDPGRMEMLLGLVNQDIRAHPARWAALVAQMKQYDPTFNGQFSSAAFAKALANQAKGYGLIAKRATQDGFTSQANSAQKAQAAAVQLGAQVTAWPTAQAYQIARGLFDDVWNDPNATDLDRKQAATRFADYIDRLAGAQGLDAAMANRLRNDALALRGGQAAPQDSFYENFLGLKGGSTGSTMNLNEGDTEGVGRATGEDAAFASEMARINNADAVAQANPGMFVYATSATDAAGNVVFDPTGKGPVRLVPVTSVNQNAQATAIVPVATVNGNLIMQAVGAQDIVVDDPSHPGGAGSVVGHALVYTQAGHAVTIYGLQRPDGTVDWTTVAPWAPGVSEVRTGGAIHLRTGATNVQAQAQALDKQYGTNFAQQIASGATQITVSTGAERSGSTESQSQIVYSNGSFRSEETTYTLDSAGKRTGESTSTTTPLGASVDVSAVWDQSRLVGGRNPLFDFSTPSMAALTTTGASSSQIAAIQGDPMFQQQLQNQVWTAAGGDANRIAAVTNQTVADFDTMKQGADARLRAPAFKPTSAADRPDLTGPGVDTGAGGFRGQRDLQPPTIVTRGTLKLPGVPPQAAPAMAPVAGSPFGPSTIGAPTAPQTGTPTIGGPTSIAAPTPPKPTPVTPTPTPSPTGPTPTPTPTPTPAPPKVPELKQVPTLRGRIAL